MSQEPKRLASFLGPHNDLLGDDLADEGVDGHAADHTLRTAPILTGDAFRALGTAVIPQCALYGRVLRQHAPGLGEKAGSPELLINSNAPFSAVVCGVQGSGKSHSTSVLLESCLIRDERLGSLPAPLSGLVFHFDTAAGGGLVQPCEAAYLAALDPTRGRDATPPQVTVLVLPTSLNVMRKVYAGLSGVRVEPLHFAPEDISGDRLLAMMKVDESNQMPLYMETILTILRSMEEFDYNQFRSELKAQKFSPTQKAMLNLRLLLLDSCLKDGNVANRVSQHFRKGQLTIIDLSSPFMDGSSACGFFDIILGLFVEAEVGTGKLVVLDEAHKYLTDSGSSSRLTESLLSVVRQQRHLNTRVVVSTQEPTVVPPKLLDLCSFILAHRFTSPTWLRHLAQHVSAADENADALFSQIVALQTGQAILFAPAGLGVRSGGAVSPLGQGYLLVRSRLRITRDGGHSLLAVPGSGAETRLGRVPGHGGAHPEEARIDLGEDRHGASGDIAGYTDVVAPVQGDVNEQEKIQDEAGWTTTETATLSDIEADTLVHLPSGANGDENASEFLEPVHGAKHSPSYIDSELPSTGDIGVPRNPVAAFKDRSVLDEDEEDRAAFFEDYSSADAGEAPSNLAYEAEAALYSSRPLHQRRALSLPVGSTAKPDHGLFYPADDVDVHLGSVGLMDEAAGETGGSSDEGSDYGTAYSSPAQEYAKLSPSSQPSSPYLNEGDPSADETQSSLSPPLSPSVEHVIAPSSQASLAGPGSPSPAISIIPLLSGPSSPSLFSPTSPPSAVATPLSPAISTSSPPAISTSSLPAVSASPPPSLPELAPSEASPGSTSSPTPGIVRPADEGSLAISAETAPALSASALPTASASIITPATPPTALAINPYAPLIAVLNEQRASGRGWCPWKLIGGLLRERAPTCLPPGPDAESLVRYMEAAANAGWVELDSGVNDRFVRLSTRPHGLGPPPARLPASPRTSAGISLAATPISSALASTSATAAAAATAQPIASGSTSNPPALHAADEPGTYAVLVEVLEEQRASGHDRCHSLQVHELLKKRVPNFPAKQKKFFAYLREAANAGWVELEPTLTQIQWVTLPRPHPVSSRAASRWDPLLHLFEEKGKTRINIGEVGELKVRRPDLIPSGKGQVRVYVQSAVQAGVVSVDGDWVVLSFA